MTERRLTFVRTNDREEAYINFFANLNKRLEQETGFPLRNMSPQGQSWIILASYANDSAYLNAAFTRRKEFRIELYIDGGDKDDTKSDSTSYLHAERRSKLRLVNRCDGSG